MQVVESWQLLDFHSIETHAAIESHVAWHAAREGSDESEAISFRSLQPA